MGLYGQYKTDRTAEQQGKWCDDFRGGVRVKIRSLQSKQAKAAQDRINKRNQRFFKTGAVIPANIQEKNDIEMAVAVTADWENVTDENDVALPFSEESARGVYSDLWEFRQQVIGAAAQADTFREQEESAEEKN